LRGAPLLLVAAALCLVAGLAAASKSAAVLLVISSTTVLLLGGRGLRYKLAALGLALVLAAAGFAVLRPTILGERFAEFVEGTSGAGEVNRLVAWRSSAGMLADYPLTGCGFGAFADVFPRYMPAGEPKRWGQLHNDYLQLLVEGGAVSGLLLLALLVPFWARVGRLALRRGPRGRSLEAVGLVLGIASLSVHALWDFNHQIPANALLFVALAAIAVAKAERDPGAAS
ncbi:MAG TPA: O-antigen ligase family protein, partial [Candidatus Polarisedimenticolaceae bacterium]|nr:O-antigen ligase family protein [Candidatus Polarisedimenticolaceae bacterium]